MTEGVQDFLKEHNIFDDKYVLDEELNEHVKVIYICKSF